MMDNKGGIGSDDEDDGPLIPDLDDVRDEDMAFQVADAPSVAVNRYALKTQKGQFGESNFFSSKRKIIFFFKSEQTDWPWPIYYCTFSPFSCFITYVTYHIDC